MKGIFDLPKSDRPREKLHARGPQALSDLELLAILLGSGNKKSDVMALARRLLSLIDKTGPALRSAELLAIAGIGPAKAAIVCAALEFSRRRIRPRNVKLCTPTDVFPLIRHIADRRQEHFICLSLNGAHEVIAVRTVSAGLVNRALVHPREVFADPITDRATAVIVAHNHPSGNLEPSRDDLTITRQLKEAGTILGIQLLDHIIFSLDGYTSLADQGHL